MNAAQEPQPPPTLKKKKKPAVNKTVHLFVVTFPPLLSFFHYISHIWEVLQICSTKMERKQESIDLFTHHIPHLSPEPVLCIFSIRRPPNENNKQLRKWPVYAEITWELLFALISWFPFSCLTPHNLASYKMQLHRKASSEEATKNSFMGMLN